MNERPNEERDPAIEATRPTEHEREVAEHEDDRPGASRDTTTVDPRMGSATRPSAEEDLAADRGRDPRDEDAP